MSEKTGKGSTSAATSARARQSVRLGSGEHTYELVEGWGRLPAGVKYGYTHGVQVTDDQRVVIHNQSKDSVIIFDEDGRFIKSWGPEFESGAHGCQLHKEGNEEFLYLSDYERHLVVKTTLGGETVWTLSWPEDSGLYQSQEEFRPTNVAVAANGDIYVADGYGKSCVHHYNSKLERIRSWGGKGSGPGQLDCPHGIWIDTRGLEPVVLVADRGNARLQYFSLNGQHIRFVTGEGLRRPCHFDQAGEALLIPDLWGVVTILDRNDKMITHLGDNLGVWEQAGWPNLPESARVPGKFISPHAACWNVRGDLYVVEWIADGRVTKLRRV